MKVILISGEGLEDPRKSGLAERVIRAVADLDPDADVSIVLDSLGGVEAQALQEEEIVVENMVMELKAVEEQYDPADPKLRKKLKKLENREQFRSKRDRRNHRR